MEVIESQRGEINRAHQGDEQLRRDQQLLHKQLLEQNRDHREVHIKSLYQMEESNRVQELRVDESSRRRLIENQDTILELTARIQELQNEINCLDVSRDFKMLNQYAVDYPTFPVDQRYSHFFVILAEC